MARALPGGGGVAFRAAASAACLAACRAAQGAEPRGPPRFPSDVAAAREIWPRGLASRTPGLDSFRAEAPAPRAVGTERTILPAFIVDLAIGRSHVQTQAARPVLLTCGQ